MRCCLFLFALTAIIQCHAGTYVQFRTIYGDIDVELYDEDKPITVQNFLRYVKTGAYRDTFFHRCVPNFVVQSGGFCITNRTTTNANLAAVTNFGAISNEFGVGQRLSNSYGTISMAKLGGYTNSASSQWFFNTANNSSLDANNTNNLFVVFGKVLGGTNVLNGFNTRFYGFGIVTNVGGVFGDLPVTYVGNRAPYYDELIYVDISLLNVQMKLTNSVREISWNSVSGRTNQVQFTTSFPPAWQTLVSTNGSGQIIRVTDPSAGNENRFYRVIVDF